MAGKLTPRYDVDNLDQWGRLVKSWATGLDYVSRPQAPQPPRDRWVNDHYPRVEGRPANKTVYATVDGSANGEPLPWCLPLPPKDNTPKDNTVNIPRRDKGSVKLPFAVAMTKEEFETRVTEARVSITDIPATIKDVVIVQGDPTTMVLRLPPKEQLQSTEDDLLNGAHYTMRPFYWALFGKAPAMPYPEDQAGLMELHANRIGEYTLNNCG
jgi:hypothetical protein